MTSRPRFAGATVQGITVVLPRHLRAAAQPVPATVAKLLKNASNSKIDSEKRLEQTPAKLVITDSMPAWLQQLDHIAIPDQAIDLTYYPPSELSELAKPLNDSAFTLPAIGMSLTSGFRVKLTLLINEKGAVDQVEVISTERQDPLLAAAIEVFKTATFTPAIRGDQFVKSRKELELCLGFCDESGRPLQIRFETK